MPTVFSTLILILGSLFFTAAAAEAGSKEPQHFSVDIVAINGEEYVVKDERGTEGKIRVGADTEKYGHFQPGDRIDAWVYPDGHAKTIMILRSAAIIQEDQRQNQAEQGQAQEHQQAHQ